MYYYWHVICRFGFHWAPFDSIEHLHLHVIAPINQMGFMARGIFLPNSLWFVTVRVLLVAENDDMFVHALGNTILNVIDCLMTFSHR